MEFTTLPALLEDTARIYDNPAAMSYPENGKWISLSNREFYDQVKFLALGLSTLKLSRHEAVGIIAHPSVNWLIADLAIMSSGHITVPIFKRISPESLAWEIKDSQLNYIFVGLEEELEAVRKHGKGIKNIIPLGIEAEGADIISLDTLLEEGKKMDREKPDLFHEMISAVTPEDLATIIYTSGSTGLPKGVELSHANIVSQVYASGERFGIGTEDTALSSLPLAHIFERMVVYFYISRGVSVHFVDDIANIGTLVKEVQPTIMTAVPRLLEKVYDKMRANVEETPGLKGKIARGALQRALTKPEAEKLKGLKDTLYNKLVFSKFREAMGGRLRMVISGAAALAPETGRFFLNIGIPLFEGYGMTEASPVIAANYPGHNKLGTVGPVFPGVEVKISEEGEILARGPNVMQGYHKNRDATKKTIEADGFLHTGDLGSLDEDGFLKITGRKKELFKKSTGEYVAPVPIEQELAKSPLVDTAVVVANDRKYVSVLIFPDQEGYESCSGEEDYRKKLSEYISTMNTHLHHTEEVVRFSIIHTPLSIEGGELTPTMKVRRNTIYEKYADEIDSMYA